MQTDFWFERWEKGEIGFHEGRNPRIRRFERQ